jgi:hypothetical protein
MLHAGSVVDVDASRERRDAQAKEDNCDEQLFHGLI